MATTRSGRRSVLLWAAGCVALLVVIAATGLGGSAPAHAVRQSGHWVYNSTLGAVVHVNGDSKHVDGKVSLPGLGPANQVTQDDQHGYVIDRRNGRVVVFGKSSLAVESTLSVGTSERPDVLEVPGGPFLIYKQRGTIVRLGQPPASVSTGGRLATPIATSDGAVWVQRPDQHALCELPPRASQLSCPATVPAGHEGTLTSLDDRPAFTDLSTGTVSPITTHGLGAATPLGPDLHAPAGAGGEAHVATSDAGGRLPVLRAVPAKGTKLVLLDTSTVGRGGAGAAPITVDLGSGRFEPPATTGGIVVVVNQSLGRIITYDNTGRLRQSVRVPAGSGVLQVTRGLDGRVYVDNEAGTRTYEIDGSGSVATVDDGDPTPAKSGPGPKPRPPVVTPPSPPPSVAADGHNTAACADGRCEIEVRVGTRIPLPARMEIGNLKVTKLTTAMATFTGIVTGNGALLECRTRSCEMTVVDPNFKVSLGVGGVGIGNGLMMTIETIKKSSAIVKIEPAPSSRRRAHR